MNIKLSDLAKGVKAKIAAVNGSGAISRRLMEMGMVPGAPVQVIKSAPFGDPLEIRVRGYNLALRIKEAQMIEVQ
jgi:Fe2+ transport system protein FeoA